MTNRKKAAKQLTDGQIIEIAKECIEHLNEKKAEHLSLLDLRGVNSYLDFFIICSGNSKMHCRSLAKETERFFSNVDMTSRLSPDYDSEWIVLDYSEIVIHVFTDEMREYFDLERLWADAEKIV
jgi:ribosome-associated protein